jgi:A/G-specific adenine glycosylase
VVPQDAVQRAASSNLVEALLGWFQVTRRDFPWRRRRDPYTVWISEVMLQQTQADTVVPYFERWMLRFPDVYALAAAPLADVLKTWEGLGYYARARNIHRAAQVIATKHSGVIPSSLDELLALPGVGRYTAGAIQSIAFGLPAPVLDANVRRLLCRLDDVPVDPTRAPANRLLWIKAQAIVEAAPLSGAGDVNEALMELGAVICTPRRPQCSVCPLMGQCEAYAQGTQERRPVVSSRPPVPLHRELAGVLTRSADDRFLLVRRPYTGLLGGLWGFPSTKHDPTLPPEGQLADALRQQLAVTVDVGPAIAAVRHAYTHFRVTLEVRPCALRTGEPDRGLHPEVAWVDATDAQRLPLATIDKKILTKIRSQRGGEAL